MCHAERTNCCAKKGPVGCYANGSVVIMLKGINLLHSVKCGQLDFMLMDQLCVMLTVTC